MALRSTTVHGNSEIYKKESEKSETTEQWHEKTVGEQ
jgi:hypothetical protein